MADVLGKPLTYQPKGAAARDVVSIFREEPIELLDSDGRPVASTQATWSVRRNLVPELRSDDRILAPNGLTYRIRNHQPDGSPAADAQIICDLEKVAP